MNAADLTTEQDSPAASDPEIPWQRLDFRVVWIDAARLLVSLIPGFVASVVYGFDTEAGPIWPLLVASGLGVLGTVLDFKRWLKTRYRITPERVERRTGWLVRKYRYVPRERIRSVDSGAKFRHRLAGLRVVHIGSGEARQSFKLDALSEQDARNLRRELMRDVDDVALSQSGEQELSEQENRTQETVISRFRWYWVLCNAVRVWAFLAAAGILLSTFTLLRLVNINIFSVLGDLATSTGLGTGGLIALGLACAFVLGTAGLIVEFIARYWNFELARATTKNGSTLLTRQGLFSTRTVYREEKRIRGVHIREPLPWRWLHLAETRVVSTGLAGSLSEPASILPRTPLSEAGRVADEVLPGDHVQPLDIPLRKHPFSALTRRLFWAVWAPGLLAGLLAWLGATGALPDRAWWFAIALLPATLPLAVVAYLALGHGIAGPYLVVRGGVVARSTVVLQHQAVIGWSLRQTVFQRLRGRMSVGIPTAAGERYYRASDAGKDQALTFVKEVTPALADQFIDTRASRKDTSAPAE
ncbi:PH domain-containing protein [Amycolatopsis lurida]